MPRNHCSEEQLLQYIDGELPGIARLRVPWHLRRCWRCRARIGAIEDQVRSLVRQIDDHPFPQELVESARSRFLRAAGAEQDFAQSQPRHRFPVPAKRILVGIALSLSAFAWWHFAPMRPTASATVHAPLPAAIALPGSHPAVLATAAAATFSPPAQRPVVQPVIPLEKAPVLTDRDELEIRALYALHKVQACLGGEIRVLRTDGEHVDITGIVESDERRREILDALTLPASNGSLRLNLRTVAELPVADLPPVALTEASDSRPARVPLEPELIRIYRTSFATESQEDTEKRVFALSNEVLRLAGVELDHAWAIENLATRYPSQRFDRLPSRLSEVVLEMVRDHASSLAATSSDLASQLAVLHLPEDGMIEDLRRDSWQTWAAVLLHKVQQLHEDAHDLFSVTGKQVDDPAGHARRLQAVSVSVARIHFSDVRPTHSDRPR